MPSGYTARIVREVGASVMTALSGGSFNMNAGAVLSASGRLQLGGGVGITGGPTFSEGGCYAPVGAVACFASSGIKLGFDLAASATAGITEIADLGNGIKFFLSKSNTTASAAGSVGSILLHLAGGTGGVEGSGARLYVHLSNAPSAGWTKIRLDIASS